MFKSIKQKVIIVIVINLIIAICYYVSNLNANYSELSSDIQNIIPVAQKFDDPSLFKKDLYLDSLDNVKYYTPFYVQSLRFIAKFVNYDYIQAINVLGLFCHLLFGILWFFMLFKITNRFWIALLISIFIRGIVWLPGLEIWGISDLWSIMPRTVYITLLPIPFLVLSSTRLSLITAAFLIGLIFNFHPITGLGGILLFVTFIFIYKVLFKGNSILSLKTILSILLFVAIGMLPFLITYFSKTSTEIVYNIEEYNVAFNRRIPIFFTDPIYFLKQWFKLKNLIYILPLFVYLWLVRKDTKAFKTAKLLLILAIVLLVIPLISIPVEQLINNTLDKNLRMSFQLVRMQKVAILPGIIAIAMLLNFFSDKYKKVNKVMPYLCGFYLLLLTFSHAKILNDTPFLSDDITRSILPHNLGLISKPEPADLMANYIANNTSKDALFCASSGFYRGAAKRSVTLDSKGASMIIEGNPAKFIEWSKQQNKVMSMDSMDDVVLYLKSLDVDYFITPNKKVNAEFIHQEGRIILYKLQ